MVVQVSLFYQDTTCFLHKFLHGIWWSTKLNAVKCNLTKLTTKNSWYFWSVVFVWYCRLSALCHCTSVFERGSLWSVLVTGLRSFLHIFGLFVDVFLLPPPPSTPSPLLTQCDRCLEDCMGAHGWVAGIAIHGSVILSWPAGHSGGPWISQAPVFHTARCSC